MRDSSATSSDGDYYTVAAGDCLSRIAAMNGYPWQKLWNHPKNADLKNQRKNPNVLMPGDEVFIPARQTKQLDAATSARHGYIVKGIPERLRLKLLDEYDKPQANVDYEFIVGAVTRHGQTDGAGELIELLSPLETSARLLIGKDKREIALSIGDLDPIDELSGVQARLANLGYYHGTVDGLAGPLTEDALRTFQAEHDLEISGASNDATRAKLLSAHGH